jgi:hypothetical protein
VSEDGGAPGPLSRRFRIGAGVVCVALVGVVLVIRLGGDDGGAGTGAGTGAGAGAGAGAETEAATGPEAGSAPDAPAAPSPFTFEEVAAEVGITHTQGGLVLPPDCLFSEPGDAPPDPEATGEALETLSACQEERSAGGVAAGDFDADGDADLYFTRLRAPGVLYENDGSGHFADVTADLGLDGGPMNGNGAGWADLENDGFPDLYVTTIAEDRFSLFMNDGSGPFTEEAVERGAALDDDEPRAGFTVSFGDIDNDGWVDIHTNEWSAPQRFGAAPSPHARLLRNRGAAEPGVFDDVTEAAGVLLSDTPDNRGDRVEAGVVPRDAFGSTLVDLDDDGWQDLLVASDFGTVRMFWNDGDGTFTEGTADTPFGSVSNAMGSTFGDVDGDGDLDWFTSSIGFLDACEPPGCVSEHSGSKLFRNDGDRRFTELTPDAGVVDVEWGWGAALADLDGDGALDLVATNGYDPGTPPSPSKAFSGTTDHAWAGDGTGAFTDVSVDAGLGPDGPVPDGDGKGLAIADLDGDGVLDVIIADTGAPPRVLLTHPREVGHWLRIAVHGSGSGREARGAVVTVTGADGRRQVRHVGVATHLLGQSELTVAVGLGSDAGPVEVAVRFPATGEEVVVPDVEVDQTIEVAEPA